MRSDPVRRKRSSAASADFNWCRPSCPWAAGGRDHRLGNSAASPDLQAGKSGKTVSYFFVRVRHGPNSWESGQYSNTEIDIFRKRISTKNIFPYRKVICSDPCFYLIEICFAHDEPQSRHAAHDQPARIIS
jgi:hypothetical protein